MYTTKGYRASVAARNAVRPYRAHIYRERRAPWSRWHCIMHVMHCAQTRQRLYCAEIIDGDTVVVEGSSHYHELVECQTFCVYYQVMSYL